MNMELKKKIFEMINLLLLLERPDFDLCLSVRDYNFFVHFLKSEKRSKVVLGSKENYY